MIQAAGYIETIETARSFVLIRGFAIGADKRTPTKLEIFYDGKLIEKTVTFYDRTDLIRAGFREPCAFVVTLPIQSPHFVPDRLFLIAEGLEVRPDSRTTIKSFAPLGVIEEFACDGVHGWVYDGREFEQSSLVNLRIGTVYFDISLDRPRRDVSKQGISDHACCGFRLPLSEIEATFAQRSNVGQLVPGQTITLQLVAKDEVVAQLEAVAPDPTNRVRGRLEKWQNGTVRGWAFNCDSPNEPLDVELMIDGVVYHRGRASHSRPDLLQRGLELTGGGFTFPLPFSPTAAPSVSVTARVVGGSAISGTLTIDHLPGIASKTGAAARAFTPRNPHGITVIVPIFNAYDHLVECVSALLRYTSKDIGIIFVDDASTDSRVSDYLNERARIANITVIVNQINEGYTRAINTGIRAAGRSDIVLLNSDAVVTPRWLANLKLAAYSAPKIATVTPFSDNAGSFSTPTPNIANVWPTGSTRDSYARAVTQSSRGLYPTVPTGSGFCFYVRRDAIDAVGYFDEEAFPRGYGEENDFCLRAVRAGWSHIIDDRTLVFHGRSASFGNARESLTAAGRAVLDLRFPEYTRLVRSQNDRPTIMAARYATACLFARELPRIRPRVLYVISTRTGGTPQTNRDLMNALQSEYDPFVLHCDGLEMQLTRFHGGGEAVVAQHRLAEPPEPSSHRSNEYDATVAEWLVAFNVELVHVRHIAFHSLGLGEVCRHLEIPIVFSFHDFYTVCPTIKLLDEASAFCRGRCTAGPGPCQVELWTQDSMPPLKHRFVNQWRKQIADFLSNCAAFVTTSQFAWTVLCEVYPEIEHRNYKIIQHGRDFDMFRQIAPELEEGKPLRVVVPGNISEAKGAGIISAIAQLDQGQSIEFHILGAAAPILNDRAGIILHGRYQRDELPDRISDVLPHVGAVFSIWPETYCHTLTELWACGLPVLAFPFGAVAERLIESKGGWLCENRTPEAILDALRKLREDPKDLKSKRNSVVSWQKNVASRYGTNEMAFEYKELYIDIFS